MQFPPVDGGFVNFFILFLGGGGGQTGFFRATIFMIDGHQKAMFWSPVSEQASTE